MKARRPTRTVAEPRFLTWGDFPPNYTTFPSFPCPISRTLPIPEQANENCNLIIGYSFYLISMHEVNSYSGKEYRDNLSMMSAPDMSYITSFSYVGIRREENPIIKHRCTKSVLYLAHRLIQRSAAAVLLIIASDTSVW
jgi:hypothetical protein